MQISGLILDVYDDYDGAVLRGIFPTFDAVPAQVKEAHVLSAEERQILPDDVFALVLVNNGESLRKYACVDEGGTALSVEYFLKNAFKLPENAQKSTAENLMTACGWYGLEAPEPLQKIALGLGTALTALTAPSVIKGTHTAIQNNLANTRALEGAGVGIVTPNMLKGAEVSGTPLAPVGGPANLSPAPPKAVIPKTAAIGRLVAAEHSRHSGEHGVELAHTVPHEQMQAPKHPQGGHMHPKVSVTNFEPPKRIREKKASVFAVPSEEKYPLDSYAQVKTANDWFGQYANHLSPDRRREFASNFMKRANELGMRPDTLNDTVRHYGSDTFASDSAIKAAFDTRRLEVAHNTDALALLGAVEKVARTRIWRDADTVVQMTPEQICGVVEEFDKVAGITHLYDSAVPDPYFSIYGFEKTAETDEAAWSDQIGNDYVTSEDLNRLAQIGAFGVKTTFGAEFQEKFLKNPVGMYQSLPRTQKKMLIRMADSTQPGVERTI